MLIGCIPTAWIDCQCPALNARHPRPCILNSGQPSERPLSSVDLNAITVVAVAVHSRPKPSPLSSPCPPSTQHPGLLCALPVVPCHSVSSVFIVARSQRPS